MECSEYHTETLLVTSRKYLQGATVRKRRRYRRRYRRPSRQPLTKGRRVGLRRARAGATRAGRRQASGACAPSRLTGRRPAHRPRRVATFVCYAVLARRCGFRLVRNLTRAEAAVGAAGAKGAGGSAVAKRHGTHLGGWRSFTGWHAWVERMGEARAEQRLVTSSRATIEAFHLRRHLPRLKSATHGANICARYPTRPCAPARLRHSTDELARTRTAMHAYTRVRPRKARPQGRRN